MFAITTVALVLVGPAAHADDDPNYPPSQNGPTTDVDGVSSGVSGGGGSGLPHTGIDPTFLWLGVAALLIGIALVVAARRRATA